MINPYEILEVAPDADDDRIKKAYLAKVRRYPPERCPEEFQRVYQAYELLKTEEDRLSYRLFHCQAPTVADCAAILLARRSTGGRPSEKEFRQRLSIDLQHVLAGFQL